MHSNKKRMAFTLIELLAAIVILSIILTIAIPYVSNIIENSRAHSFEVDANSLYNIIYTEQVGNKSFDPTTVNQSNLSSKLKVSSNNYQSINVYYDNSLLTAAIVGKNKWEKLTAVVNKNGVNVATTISNVTTDSCFTFNETTKTITKYDYATCSTDVVIPNTINGVTVEHIGQGAFNNPTSQTCSAPSGDEYGVSLSYVHTDGDGYKACYYNFSGSSPVTSVILPAYLKTIEQDAFSRTQIASIVIPNGVTYIGDSAFNYDNITSLIIPSSVTEVGFWAFEENYIDNLTLSNGLVLIEGGAFERNKLTNITIPSTVTSIDSFAFNDNKLTTIAIPSTVTFIGEGAFNNNQLADAQAFIYKRNTDGSVDNSTVVSYGGANRSNVVIPSNVTTIGRKSFAYNHLTGITIPSSVTTLSDRSFSTNLLTSVTIPSSITQIATHAFQNNRLTSVVIPNTVTRIEYYAFANNQLSSLTIPSSVTYINYSAFEENQIPSLTIPSSVTTINDWAFSDNKITSLSLPSTLTKIGRGAFNDNLLADAQAFIYARNSDTSINNSIVVSYGGAKRSSVVIPSNVTTIGRSAFGYNSLTSVTIPSSVTSIIQAAFYSNSLSSIIIPSSVTSIEQSAFASNAFTSVTIQGANPQRFNGSWTTIGFPSNLMP